MNKIHAYDQKIWRTYAHISHKPALRRIRTANAQSSVTESHYTRGLLTLLTTGEVKKKGFQISSQTKPGNSSTKSGPTGALALSQGCTHSQHHYTYTQLMVSATGRSNFTTRTVLYGTFGIHHLAYFNIFVPVVILPKDFLPDFLKILNQFLTTFTPHSH